MVMSSTNGYWKEIFFLHFLHFAKINKYEIADKISYQEIFFLHFGQ